MPLPPFGIDIILIVWYYTHFNKYKTAYDNFNHNIRNFNSKISKKIW